MFNKNIPEKCKDCPILTKKLSNILEEDDSVFDAVSDFDRFIEKCLKTCDGKEVIYDK